MKSWSNWEKLDKNNVAKIPRKTKGVYAIRMAQPPKDKGTESDIIYIGCSKAPKRGVYERLSNLLEALEIADASKARKRHSAAPCIRKYARYGLEFSWIGCPQAPDGVEKAFLLAFWASHSELPKCNEKF